MLREQGAELEQQGMKLEQQGMELRRRDAELEQYHATLRQRDAQLAEAFNRAKKEEILRHAIETSTFWRATKVARTVVGWLKS
jgi:hypothetical protein